MKKLILFLFLAIFITGCNQKTKQELNQVDQASNSEINTTVKPAEPVESAEPAELVELVEKKVVITKELIIEDKKICAFNPMNNCTIERIIPADCLENIEKMSLLMQEAPDANMRDVYYCKNRNQFWIHNADKNSMTAYWYGPYEGAPERPKTATVENGVKIVPNDEVKNLE